MLSVCTLIHFAVDGLCAAVMAGYAVNEPDFARIVYYFSLYNATAFGGQWIAGLMLDKHNRFILPSLVIVPVLLALGMLTEAGIFFQAIFLGLGNCIFHVAAGIIIMIRSDNFREPGIFVSSGAVGLGLGLGSFVGALWFWALCTGGTIILVHRLLKDRTAYTFSRDDTHISAPVFAGALILLLCVVMRGFGGNSNIPEYAMLMPCVYMLGKSAGGIVCDIIGYRKTILLIFIMCFVSLQLSGYASLILLTFAFNMTMPLTLRLLHRYFPEYPGLTFGLAAGCLLPGAFFGEYMRIFPDVMAAVQFMGMFAAWLIFCRYGRCAESLQHS